jgi:hypothetical protein
LSKSRLKNASPQKSQSSARRRQKQLRKRRKLQRNRRAHPNQEQHGPRLKRRAREARLKTVRAGKVPLAAAAAKKPMQMDVLP